MAIEAQRYPKKENPITSEEELVVELEEANDLADSSRGEGGYGSTGN